MEALIPWKQIIALALPFIIMAVVWLIKSNYDFIKPYLPIVAPIAGAVLTPAAIALSAWLGVPVDFTPIMDALNGLALGAAAVGIHQIGKQWHKREKVVPLPSIEMVDGKVKRGL